MNCSSPGSSVHGISQARVLEWVAISFSRGSSLPRNLLAHFVPTEVSGGAERLGSLESLQDAWGQRREEVRKDS